MQYHGSTRISLDLSLDRISKTDKLGKHCIAFKLPYKQVTGEISSRKETGTPRKEAGDVQRMQGRGDLGLHLYIPRGKGRSLSAETRISEMDSIFIAKPSAVMAVPFAGIFSCYDKAIPS